MCFQAPFENPEFGNRLQIVWYKSFTRFKWLGSFSGHALSLHIKTYIPTCYNMYNFVIIACYIKCSYALWNTFTAYFLITLDKCKMVLDKRNVHIRTPLKYCILPK